MDHIGTGSYGYVGHIDVGKAFEQGSVAGGMVGGVGGAAAGSVVPGLGTMLGGCGGALAGGAIGGTVCAAGAMIYNAWEEITNQ
ncbi:MAG: hypothetical protein ACYCW6_15525 [Candidatus Xenobia bacterium]